MRTARPGVVWAFFNDLAQRILTWNKAEQRANVRRVFQQIGHRGGVRVLDYGCGTGLFATTLAENEARYVGYDIEEGFVRYASRLYTPLLFTHEKEKVVTNGPYDYVLANCCFHHIPDAEVGGAFDFIKGNLDPDGYFVLVDILKPPERRSTFRQVCGLLERGDFIRRHADYMQLIEARFEIVSLELSRAHLLSSGLSPFYSDLGIYVCRLRAKSVEGNQAWA